MEWEEVIKEGSIFAALRVIASQGQFPNYEGLLEDIAGMRNGGGGRSSIRDLDEALVESARAIVRFWTDESVRGCEYPLTRIWIRYNEVDVGNKNEVVRFSRSKIQDVGRFIRLNPGIIRIKRGDDTLVIPEEIVIGSILPFLEHEGWALIGEAFQVSPTVLVRNARLISEIYGRWSYCLYEITYHALLASARNEEERHAYIIAARALLETIREWDSIEGGLVAEIDSQALHGFEICYGYFFGNRHICHTESILETLDAFIQALGDISSAIRQRVILPQSKWFS